MSGPDRIRGVALTALLTSMFCGCVFHVRAGSQRFDEQRVGHIVPSVTTMTEIFDSFGPPDFIIDGTQRVVDTESVLYQYKLQTLPTRVVTAPQGTVILIYAGGEGSFTGGYVPGPRQEPTKPDLAIEYARTAQRSDELWIFISKEDKTVMSIARPAIR